MTRDDALTLVGWIVNSWPGPLWEKERLDAYATALEPLDAEVTSRAIARAVKEVKYRPSIAELREFVQIERRLTEAEEARYVMPDKVADPLWVKRWRRARAAGDRRPFPEQMTALDALARQSPEDYKAYAPPEHPVGNREYWVQPEEYVDPPAIVEA